ncbi:MAG: hypothetical protein HZA16_07980 [Nitrospirae bacterium]|nr:hypothetical protein [Nitrospirota bacterium]
MNNSERYNFEDFTRENYRRLLILAKNNYIFRTFTDFSRDERFILWRHDVDFSLNASLKLAQIESDEGMPATYFLHLHNIFYNLLEHDNADIVRRILSCGHHIGLHFDSDFYSIESENELEKYLRIEKKLLEDTFGQEIKVFSFHNPLPFTMRCNKWNYAGMINTYAEYFQKEVGYCSDSNGYWRHRRLENVLSEARDERLQVLTHPAWWQDTVMSPKGKTLWCMTDREERTRRRYEEMLKTAGRENIDWE